MSSGYQKNAYHDLNSNIQYLMAYSPNKNSPPPDQFETHTPIVQVRSPIKIVGRSERKSQQKCPTASFGNLHQSTIGMTRTVKLETNSIGMVKYSTGVTNEDINLQSRKPDYFFVDDKLKESGIGFESKIAQEDYFSKNTKDKLKEFRLKYGKSSKMHQSGLSKLSSKQEPAMFYDSRGDTPRSNNGSGQKLNITELNIRFGKNSVVEPTERNYNNIPKSPSPALLSRADNCPRVKQEQDSNTKYRLVKTKGYFETPEVGFHNYAQEVQKVNIVQIASHPMNGLKSEDTLQKTQADDLDILELVKKNKRSSRSYRLEKLERISENLKKFKKKTSNIEVEVTSCKKMLENVMQKIDKERARFQASSVRCEDLKLELQNIERKVDKAVSHYSKEDQATMQSHLPGGEHFSRGSHNRSKNDHLNTPQASSKRSLTVRSSRRVLEQIERPNRRDMSVGRVETWGQIEEINKENSAFTSMNRSLSIQYQVPDQDRVPILRPLKIPYQNNSHKSKTNLARSLCGVNIPDAKPHMLGSILRKQTKITKMSPSSKKIQSKSQLSNKNERHSSVKQSKYLEDNPIFNSKTTALENFKSMKNSLLSNREALESGRYTLRDLPSHSKPKIPKIPISSTKLNKQGGGSTLPTATKNINPDLRNASIGQREPSMNQSDFVELDGKNEEKVTNLNSSYLSSHNQSQLHSGVLNVRRGKDELVKQDYSLNLNTHPYPAQTLPLTLNQKHQEIAQNSYLPISTSFEENKMLSNEYSNYHEHIDENTNTNNHNPYLLSQPNVSKSPQHSTNQLHLENRKHEQSTSKKITNLNNLKRWSNYQNSSSFKSSFRNREQRREILGIVVGDPSHIAEREE